MQVNALGLSSLYFIEIRDSYQLYLTLVAFRHLLQVERDSGLYSYGYARQMEALVSSQRVDFNVQEGRVQINV